MTGSVRLIPSRKIRDGVELARDVFNGPPGTAPLLRAGVKLSARYATLLPKAGVGSVWIEDELGANIDIVDSLADVASSMVQDLLDCPEAAMALDDLNAFDDYTHRHSVQVTLIGLLI